MAIRWLATGVAVAYTAVGVQAVSPALAQELPKPAGQTQASPQTTGQGAGPYQFNIPAGPLDDVIDAFEATARIEIELARAGMANLSSPGVQGSYSVEQALERALQGTGITFRYRAPGVVVLELASATQSLEVFGEIPKISSPKYPQPLVDTPQTIAIIPQRVFYEQGARNLTDVLRNTPGITFEAGENGFGTQTANFSMRGIDSTGNIFIDGVRDSGNYFRDVFNLEQVEVVKGPASDNGRGGAGGYVNLVTKRPALESYQRLSLAYGWDEYSSKNRPRAAFDLNQRIKEGTAVRLNAFWEEGGMIGRETVEHNGWGLAPSVAFGLHTATRFSLGYQVFSQNDLPDWGVPAAMMRGMLNYNPVTADNRYRGRFYGHSADYDDVMAHSLIGRFERDLAKSMRLTNTTRWSKTDRVSLYAVPTGFAAANLSATTQRQAFDRDNQTVANLTNFDTSFQTGAVRHSVAAGLEFTSEGSSANRYPTNGILGNPGSTPLMNPNPNRPLTGFVGLNPTQAADIDIKTVGAYLYDTMRLDRRWLLSAGLRMERYWVDLQSRTIAGAPQGPDGYNRADTTFTGKVGLTFKPTEHSSIYGSAGVAALPPASYLSNPDISREGDNAFPGWSAGPNSATSKVQSARLYEIGGKWDINGDRLGVTAAAFRTERYNIAMAGTLNGVPNTFAGYAEQILQGIELGITGSITRAWSVYGGALVMDSKRQHSPQVDQARIGANPADYGPYTTTNGNQLAFTPNTSYTVWTSYTLPFGLTLGGGVRHAGDSYLGRPDNAERIIPNGRAGRQPGYTVLDLMAAYRVNRHFTLRFNIDNVTDAFYPASSNWAGERIFLGPARNFRISSDIFF